MELTDAIVTAIAGIKDAERRSQMLRRIVLNEAYYNLGIIEVLRTKAVAASADDRDRLVRQLRTGSRGAHDLFSVEKGTLAKLKDAMARLVGDEDHDEIDDFAAWTDTEVYHYTLNKIDVLKAIVEAQLACAPKLHLDRRLANIRIALHALVGKLRV